MADGEDEVGALLVAREAERREALISDDMDKLADLLTDDLVHVHTTGAVHDKTRLLHHAGVFLRFLDVQRGELKIRRICEHAAVMTGPMTNKVCLRGEDEQVSINAFVTQLWVKRDGQWRIASFHSVRLPEAA